MYKSLLFITDVNKGSIQGGKNLLYLAEVYIPDRKRVPVAGLLVQFDEPVVLHQGYRYLSRIDIDNKILNRFHQENSFSGTK